MSVRDPDALPPDVSELLRDAGDPPGPDAAQSAALFARLSMTLDLPPMDPPPGDGGGNDTGGPGSAGNTGGSGGPGPGGVAASSAGAAKGSLAALIVAKPLPFAAAMFAIGAVSGAGVVTVVSTPARDPVAAVGEAPAPAAAPIVVADPAEEIAPAATRPQELRVRKRPVAAPAVGTDEDLAEERALLEMARSAVAKSDFPRGLDAVDSHASRFPNGRLAEEREFLRIQSLVGLGRGADAQATAARFERAFPKSFLIPVVRELITPGGTP